jgi:hypothetical protein
MVIEKLWVSSTGLGLAVVLPQLLDLETHDSRLSGEFLSRLGRTAVLGCLQLNLISVAQIMATTTDSDSPFLIAKSSMQSVVRERLTTVAVRKTCRGSAWYVPKTSKLRRVPEGCSVGNNLQWFCDYRDGKLFFFSKRKMRLRALLYAASCIDRSFWRVQIMHYC